MLNRTDPATKQPIWMSKEQVAAAIALLRKTLPDLASTQITAEVAIQQLNDGRPPIESLLLGPATIQSELVDEGITIEGVVTGK